MNKDNIKQLLPIGSVVLLKDAEKRLMIFGVCQTDRENRKDYDYVGVLYPEGNVGEEVRFLFNHEDIQQVDFEGYRDDERDRFLENLHSYYTREE